MYSIDKERFGLFIAALRREKGLTQKEVADRLFLSDKAVSKWERGASLPDTALLVPLAELLGVSVAELLRSERMVREQPMAADEVEDLVKSAMVYAKTEELPALCKKKPWRTLYPLSALVGMAGTALHFISGCTGTTPLLMLLFGLFFGAYFCFFAREKLPAYYDENRIGGIHDGFFRMNVPGLAFNNSNWPYILLVGRLWSCASMMLFPALATCIGVFLPELWEKTQLALFFAAVFGGLFVPVYLAGKKYE